MTQKIAVVTGSEGHIGRHICTKLLKDRYFIYGIDINKNTDFLTESANYKFLRINLEQEEERNLLRGMLFHNRIDSLINNAAFGGDEKSEGWTCEFSKQSLSTWRRAIEINVTAPFHLAQLAKELLLKSEFATIINISSIYGGLAPDFSIYEGTEIMNPAAYSVSKAGLNQLTKWLASNLGPEIRVNAIAPGGVERRQSDLFQEKYIKKTLLKRMASEEDIANSVRFLVSDASSYITGQVIYVDGGFSCT